MEGYKKDMLLKTGLALEKDGRALRPFPFRVKKNISHTLRHQAVLSFRWPYSDFG